MPVIFIEKLCGFALAKGVIFATFDFFVGEIGGFYDLPDGIMPLRLGFQKETQGDGENFRNLLGIWDCGFVNFIGDIGDIGLNHATINRQHEVTFPQKANILLRDADFLLGFPQGCLLEGFPLFPMSAGKADIPRLIYPCGAFCQNEMQFSAYLCQQSKNGEMAQLPNGGCLMRGKNSGDFFQTVFMFHGAQSFLNLMRVAAMRRRLSSISA